MENRNKGNPAGNAGKKAYSSPKLLNETPDVVGQMTSVLDNGGSLDEAVRSVAKNGPPISRKLFKEVCDDADLRVESDIRSSLSKRISSIPENNSAYTMAIRLVMSAEIAKEGSERSRILKDASEIALDGLKESGKTYCSSLNTPCMLIFGLGIMVPLVLMSVLPMMGMSGMFGGSPMSSSTLSVITLVLIPAAVLGIILSNKDRNPLAVPKVNDPLSILVLSALPISIAVYLRTGDRVTSVCIGAAAGCILYLLAAAKDSSSEKKRIVTDRKIRESVFELGNRMLAGETFENALVDLLENRKECAGLSKDLKNELAICRGNVETAISDVFSRVSPATAEVLLKIYRISKKDLSDAGRMALSFGRQLRDQEVARTSIRNGLKSMTDTMFGTAAFFAPLVLGLSVSILGPMKEIAGVTDDGSSSLVLACYLIELCGLISILLSSLDSKPIKGDCVRRFAALVPVSMIVFLFALGMSI